MADDDFIVPPAWLSAPTAPAPVAPAATGESSEEITLPPGIADSATHRLPEERQRTPPPKPEVTFFPGAIGAPVPTAPPPPPVVAPSVPTTSQGYPPPNPAEQASVAPPAPPAPAYAPPTYAPPPPPLVQAPKAPVASAAPTAPPPPTFAAPVPRWSLALENGLTVPVTGAVYLGRNPSAGAEHPAAATLTIDDPRKSISKTHALLVVDGDGAWLTDLHSTNGCAVLAIDGSETVLTPGVALAVPAGATIELGEYAIRLNHG